MTGILPKPNRAVSPKMLVASAMLHGVLLAAAAIYSVWLLSPASPPEPAITQVKLVEHSVGLPKVEKVEPEASFPSEPQSLDLEEIAVAAEPEAVPRERVEVKALKSRSPEPIPVQKSKRRPKRVEQQDKETPPPGSPKKKDNPESYLRERLAQIREQVSKKGRIATPAQAGSGNRTGSQQGQFDEELARWLKEVRERVNSHWSVFENISVREDTVIGVKIADDGRLIDATVDKSSGNRTFDLSAERAVRQAAPFPFLPQQLRDQILKAGGLALRFTSSGMQ